MQVARWPAQEADRMPTPTDPIIPDPAAPPADPAATPTPAAPPADDLDFEGDFDAERAKRLILGLRADKQAAKDAAAEVARERDELKTKWQAHEADQLTDAQRQAQELAAAKQELAAERRKSALTRHGLADTALIFLTAESAEDIEAQAAALASLQGPAVPPAPTPDLHVEPRSDLNPAGQQIPPSEPPFDPVAIARAARRH